jgi:uncharacterized protein YejL (UPF0352 family)
VSGECITFFAASFEKVRAKFAFDAISDKQLSMKVGDIVVVLEKSASGWFKGEMNGAVGLFPSNYTEPFIDVAFGSSVASSKVAELKAKRLQAKNSSSPEVAASTIQRLVRSKSQSKRGESSVSHSKVEVVRASFAFKPVSDNQLALNVGDIVTVIEKHASGWYKGECNGAVGLFPSNYTQPVNDASQKSGTFMMQSSFACAFYCCILLIFVYV